MIILRKKFSQFQVLNTRGTLGFDKSRKYDQNLSRLGEMGTAQRELHNLGSLRQETRKLSSILNNKETWQK